MKVSELIKTLQNFPDEAIAITDGYENDYDLIKEISELFIADNPKNDWWKREFIKSNNSSGRTVVYLNTKRKVPKYL